MPGRHVAPRHKPVRSVKRSLTVAVEDASAAIGRPRTAATLAIVGAATLATGLGVYSAQPGNADQESTATAGQTFDAEVSTALSDHEDQSDRSAMISRSGTRPPAIAVQRATKARALRLTNQSHSRSVTKTVPPADPRVVALSLLPAYGWGSGEYSCLDQLWISESDWDPYAVNPTTGAYGIPQSLPPEKMATAGGDWRTNPATQIEWGLEYIYLSYGTPCSAWSFKQANNWY